MKFIIDMDGVLAKWENVPFEETMKEGYFLSRQPQINMIEAVKILKKSFPVCINSKTYNDDHSAKEKREWLKIYLPEIEDNEIVFSNYGDNKPKEGSTEDFLIDDYTPNLRSFVGTSVKLRNGIKGYNTGETWQGFAIDYRQDAIAIAKTLTALAIAKKELQV